MIIFVFIFNKLINTISPRLVQTLGCRLSAVGSGGKGAGEWKCVIYKLCSQRRSEADGEPELGTDQPHQQYSQWLRSPAWASLSLQCPGSSRCLSVSGWSPSSRSSSPSGSSDQWPGDQGTMSRSLMGSRRGSFRLRPSHKDSVIINEHSSFKP